MSQFPFKKKDLKPFTFYRWTLRYGKTLILTGNITTPESAPSAVLSLAAMPLNSTALSVSWDAPSKPNGIIKHYNISYRHNTYKSCKGGYKSNNASKGQVETKETFVVLNNLLAYSEYSVGVAAYTVAYGKNASITEDTLELDIPQVRPEPGKRSVETNKEYVEFYWSPPKDCTAIKGSIKGYDVTLIGLSPWARTTQIMPVVQQKEQEQFARFEKLIPYTQYLASVFVRSPKNLTNPALPYSVNFTTLPDGK
ncbi:Down syndrome cell adhesion molecule-like protein 1 [Zootermopsis nevadensis]|uniref:Down syndrome cell adhesion molecule-like protein 1 n=2 Tax=Zootermopsis nevadensis TaxID=136037 RepID=A0A067RIC4_ZOONE|nr:Down syndrome cell adhesion molecule-like protein 1 [Zootermopsis nevadensis]